MTRPIDSIGDSANGKLAVVESKCRAKRRGASDLRRVRQQVFSELQPDFVWTLVDQAEHENVLIVAPDNLFLVRLLQRAPAVDTLEMGVQYLDSVLFLLQYVQDLCAPGAEQEHGKGYQCRPPDSLFLKCTHRKNPLK